MTLDDVKRLASLGEGQHLEFKHRVPRPERIAREVIAFANAEGGTVLLGVADDGEVVGLKDSQEELYALDQALRTRVKPVVRVQVERIRLSRRRDVLVVEVSASHHRPHFLVPNDPTQEPAAFTRSGADSVEASPEAVRLMEEERNPEGVQFTFGDRERRLLEYLDRHERITVRQYARMVGAEPGTASETLVLLTRAGVLRLHPGSGGEDYFTADYSEREAA